MQVVGAGGIMAVVLSASGAFCDDGGDDIKQIDARAPSAERIALLREADGDGVAEILA